MLIEVSSPLPWRTILHPDALPILFIKSSSKAMFAPLRVFSIPESEQGFLTFIDLCFSFDALFFGALFFICLDTSTLELYTLHAARDEVWAGLVFGPGV